MTEETDSAATTTVFFSYSRIDQAQALPIIQAIEAAGYRVWWDGMLEGGTEFLDETESALENAKAVVVLWSQQAVGSHWVRDEATSGRERERLIPLSLDGTMPPLGFRQLQVIDMRKWHTRPDVEDELLRGLAKLHDRDYVPLDPAHRFGGMAAAKPLVSRRALLLAGGAVAVGGVGFMINHRRVVSRALATSVAVLPFENKLRGDGFDYVADGMASAVRDGLSMNPLLRITAQSSSQEAASAIKDSKKIARALNVGHVLEGRLEALDDRPQLIIKLINWRNGYVQLTKTYPFLPDRIIALKDSVIQDVVKYITERDAAPVGGGTENPAAFNEYIQANNLLNQGATIQNIEGATQRYRRAIELDQKFALAHSALAEQLLLLGAISGDKAASLQLIQDAVELAQLGVDLAPELASPHISLGFVLMSGRADFRAAKIHFDRAEKLGLHRNGDMNRSALYFASAGNGDKATIMAQRAAALDPLNPAAMETLAYTYYSDGQFERAADIYRDVLRSDPNRHTVRSWLGLSTMYAGDTATGLELCGEDKNLMERFTCQAIAQSRLDDVPAATESYNRLVNEFGDAAAYQQAQIQAQMQQADTAMATLQKAERLQDTGLAMARFDPALDPLRGRSDFQALLVRLGLSD